MNVMRRNNRRLLGRAPAVNAVGETVSARLPKAGAPVAPRSCLGTELAEELVDAETRGGKALNLPRPRYCATHRTPRSRGSRRLAELEHAYVTLRPLSDRIHGRNHAPTRGGPGGDNAASGHARK